MEIYRNTAVYAYIVEGDLEGWQGIKVEFASISDPECNVQDFGSWLATSNRSLFNFLC